MPLASDAMRQALRELSYGVYIVTSHSGEKLNGQISNAVIQVTCEPACILAAINKKELTHDYIVNSGVLAVGILADDTPLKFIGTFGYNSGRNTDKFAKIPYKLGVTGCPLVTENVLSFIEAKVSTTVDAGSHSLFIANIINAEIIKEGIPLTYANFHKVTKGTSPPNAPTYQAPAKTKNETGESAMKYTCTVCGYVYDPEVGDPDNGVAAGTAFADIPEDWTCPACGVGKDMFEAAE